ncbi:hypothetical protein HN695_00080 [Candidatus Woesearchaeota archaeon]|jgi:hypothetical protein|nr:hypothetical protein [Candidatus Woesearchaeota archaeon]MBT5272861.1 hypothetical protein [Candidatus Woesearchaeota archaeon]MBT6041327.1 hypothetical protein [Candidatus Woesearchaeota archaeon]MBT6336407.1 hypothetical protein [Candidatus Woesearchaeota archaeon]MBT7926710.1 hypothetical protein [Candidatus Woesearchaeota archaeon]
MICGAFCDIYGRNLRNAFLETILVYRDIDFAACTVVDRIEISKPKAYELVYEYEKKGYIEKSRILGKTQLYKLNKKNLRVKLLMKAFKDCLKLIAEEYEEKEIAVKAAKKKK